MNLCVYYLPPEGSTRNVDVDHFYETLLSEIYVYHNNGMFYICGNLNSRIGDSVDFIEGVDDLPEREIIDLRHNLYGDKMIDFLLRANCCVLNGSEYKQ